MREPGEPKGEREGRKRRERPEARAAVRARRDQGVTERYGERASDRRESGGCHGSEQDKESVRVNAQV